MVAGRRKRSRCPPHRSVYRCHRHSCRPLPDGAPRKRSRCFWSKFERQFRSRCCTLGSCSARRTPARRRSSKSESPCRKRRYTHARPPEHRTRSRRCRCRSWSRPRKRCCNCAIAGQRHKPARHPRGTPAYQSRRRSRTGGSDPPRSIFPNHGVTTAHRRRVAGAMQSLRAIRKPISPRVQSLPRASVRRPGERATANLVTRWLPRRQPRIAV